MKGLSPADSNSRQLDQRPVLAIAPLKPGFDRDSLSRYGDPSWDLGPAVFRENARRCHVTVHFTSVENLGVREALRELDGVLVQESGFASMADLLLTLNRFGAVVGEVPLLLRYDYKHGASKMRILQTVQRTLRMMVRHRFGRWSWR